MLGWPFLWEAAYDAIASVIGGLRCLRWPRAEKPRFLSDALLSTQTPLRWQLQQLSGLYVKCIRELPYNL
jgi:hypothetical protein